MEEGISITVYSGRICLQMEGVNQKVSGERVITVCLMTLCTIYVASSFILLFPGELMGAIKRDFGSFDAMKKQVSAAAVGVQGSGWSWLGFNPTTKRLQIAACPNQDPLQPTTGKCKI